MQDLPSSFSWIRAVAALFGVLDDLDRRVDPLEAGLFAEPAVGGDGHDDVARVPEVEPAAGERIHRRPGCDADGVAGRDQAAAEKLHVVVEFEDARNDGVLEAEREPEERLEGVGLPGDDIAEPSWRLALVEAAREQHFHPVDPERARRRLGTLGGSDRLGRTRRPLEIGLRHTVQIQPMPENWPPPGRTP